MAYHTFYQFNAVKLANDSIFLLQPSIYIYIKVVIMLNKASELRQFEMSDIKISQLVYDIRKT